LQREPQAGRTASHLRPHNPGGASRCTDVRKGLAYYQARAREWAHRMGATAWWRQKEGRTVRLSCPQIRRAARFWRSKARAWHRRYERWSYEWEWQRWLPAKFYRVARCETGVDWRFDSGTYVSAFGIIRVAFPSWNGRNTPREQYEVAAAIQRRYGWGAWGCGGA